MDAKRAVLIALGLALGLPYLTVVLLQGGRIGSFAVGALFIGAILLLVVSDIRDTDVPAEDG